MQKGNPDFFAPNIFCFWTVIINSMSVTNVYRGTVQSLLN